MSIKELALFRGHGKGSYTHYFNMYDDIFADFRDKHIRVLEIGNGDGNFLRLCKSYFTQAEIVGLDINPDVKLQEEDRIKIISGDQIDMELLKSLGEFDIIVDDGGHTADQQITSFRILFPLMRINGWYFIEDLHCAYGNPPSEMWGEASTVEFLKKLVDSIIMPQSFPSEWPIAEMRIVDSLIGMKKARSLL